MCCGATSIFEAHKVTVKRYPVQICVAQGTLHIKRVNKWLNKSSSAPESSSLTCMNQVLSCNFKGSIH